MAERLPIITNRDFRTRIKLITQAIGLDVFLFFILMMYKLVLFDHCVHVPNMTMDEDDVKVAIGTLALASFWTFWLPLRGRIITLTILNLALTSLVYSDLIYFRYFQDLISIPVLTQAGQVSSLRDSIDSLLNPIDIWFFIDWPFIILFTILMILRKRQQRVRPFFTFTKPKLPKRIMMRLSLSLIVFATGLILVFVPIHIAKKTWATCLFEGNWWNMSLYNVTGVIGFHGYDMFRYANAHVFSDHSLPKEQVNEAKQWFAARGRERKWLENDPLFGKYKEMNVIMLQLEAFQNFVIGQKINGQEVTPHINKLLEKSMYFPSFYHQTSQGRTSDADMAANASLHPLIAGSIFIRYPQHQYDSMPATLKKNGYLTSAFHAYDGGFWNRNMMYKTLGYDNFYNKKSFKMNESIGWSLGDNSFFQQSIDRMKNQKQPFYSYLISMSSHHPYPLPESYQTLNVGEFKGTIFGDYLEAIHYVDESIGHMVERLKAEGLWNKSIFLFYGDHDNSIHNWKPFETFLGKPLSELDQLNIVKQVPLVIHLPNNDRAGVYNQIGGQLDLTPTILHLLGISSANKYFAGMPLVTEKPLAGKKVILRDGSYTNGKVFYIPPDDGKPEHSKCYDIANGGLTDTGLCTAGAAAAHKELIESDLVVQHDLIRTFRKK